MEKTNYREKITVQKQEMPRPQQKPNYTELLEKEYGNLCPELILAFRRDSRQDEEIYEFLESFY